MKGGKECIYVIIYNARRPRHTESLSSPVRTGRRRLVLLRDWGEFRTSSSIVRSGTTNHHEPVALCAVRFAQWNEPCEASFLACPKLLAGSHDKASDGYASGGCWSVWFRKVRVVCDASVRWARRNRFEQVSDQCFSVETRSQAALQPSSARPDSLVATLSANWRK